ncbi:hydroxyneurosporene-O-methyltransferase [Streptomyces sp. 3212.3]|uniref:methyltransferase n=1 Tax=Streptomyces sp. 3212.3 TaxID=1938846 RepID=UPI000E227302|nr:methyltransferase [Streptomyces sp. 3212.3]REE64011.1 hydroxyneurosporene-O-methyltransferase [Streptomyces sp. 3212.3]
MTDEAQPLPAALQMQQLLTGFEVSQALYVIAELEVATALLDGPRSIESLAAETHADSDALGRIIRFLTPLGVFRSVEGGVEVTDLGRTLADGPADSVRGLARYWMETHYGPFSGLLHAARTGEPGARKVLGKPFFDWVGESPRLTALQNSAMAGGGRAVRGNLLDVYQLPQGRMIADIGGADGTLLAELLTKSPERQGMVFDLPGVVSKAADVLAAAGVADRATAVAGDFFVDAVPTADIYVLSVVLHDWDDASALSILRNIAKAAPTGARLVLVETVMPVGDGPHYAKMLDLTMLAMLGGRERTERQWHQLLAEAGFTVERIVAGSGIVSAIEATLT